MAVMDTLLKTSILVLGTEGVKLTVNLNPTGYSEPMQNFKWANK